MAAQRLRDRTEPAAPARGAGMETDRNPARVLSAIALASIAAGAINYAAAATVGRGSTQNMAFFVGVASAQLLWGAAALARAPRWWLALGAVGNLAVVVTWALSRTVGLPAGDLAGVRLPVGFADTLATALEAAIVFGAGALAPRGRVPARSLTRSPGVTAATAVIVGALALAGVLSQTGALGSSSGTNDNGTGGVNAPATPSGGGYIPRY